MHVFLQSDCTLNELEEFSRAMSLKADCEEAEPECLEGEPLLLKKEQIFLEEPLFPKVEPLFLEEPLKEEPFLEDELNWDLSAWADLYTDHDIKNDVVIGPVILQPQDAAFATPVSEKSCEQPAPTESATCKPVAPSHRCYICLRTFLDDSLLINHVCIPQDVHDTSIIPHSVHEQSCKTDQANNRRDKPNFIRNYSAGEPFYCDICQKQLKHYSTLKSHRLTHLEVFLCKICNMKFRYQNDLDTHQKYHVGYDNKIAIDVDTVVRNGVGHYTCIKDTAPPGSSGSSDVPHVLQRSNEGIQDDPARVKGNPSDSNKHKLEHKKEKYLYCEVCKKQIKVKRNLNAHMQAHIRMKQKYCELCKKYFHSKKYLIKHKQRHTGEIFPCHLCKKTFMAERLLLIHKRIHIGEETFICDICQKVFKRKNKLVAHIKYHIRSNSCMKRFSCDICEKKFSNSSSLSAHKLVHGPEKKHSCAICEKRFHLKSVLMKHTLYVHEGKKPFKCKTCQKAFPYSCNLRIHELIHGEKKLICKICGKKFHQKSGLLSHMAIHTARDPFICDVCNRHFNRKTALIGHIKIKHTEGHSNMPPFFLLSPSHSQLPN